MKKLLFLALLSSGGIAKAQSIGAGTISLGGNVGYHVNTDKSVTSGTNGYTRTDQQKEFNLTVGANYFVVDNLSVGFSVNHVALGGNTTFSPTQSGFIAPGAPHGWKWRVGPTAQYYKMFTEQFGVIGTLSGGYENNRIRNLQMVAVPVGTGYPPLYYYSDETAKGYYGGLTPSIVFFPVPRFGLTASIGSLEYRHVNNSSPVSNVKYSSSSFGTNFGFDQLLFGGNYYFGR
jgi:hypothetical protein